ncbi:MAG: SelT/SelW/SelH family protein [Dehalococcoidia bacterium]
MSEDAKRLAVEIAYCSRCNFLPRATWVAQELLHTYGDFVSGLTLVPAHGGIFEVRVNGELVASTKTEGGFPEIRTLKEALNRYLADDEIATLKRHPKKA